MKGAFHRIERKKIWKIMEKKSINTRLGKRIEGIYDMKKFKDIVRNEISEEINTINGVRHGCPLNTALFNLTFADLEREMKKILTGGVVIGKEKVWLVLYADGVVLMVNNEEGMREIIKKFRKYIERRGLEMNTSKSNIMSNRNGARKRKIIFELNGEELEAKENNYFGYNIQQNNSNEKKMQNPRVVGKVRSITERRFKKNWEIRMFLFKVLVECVLMYGAEISG